MIVIGAKGFAKELLEVLVSDRYNYTEENLFFFDDITEDLPEYLFGKFKIINSITEVKTIFKTISNSFCLGLGNPKNREILTKNFLNLGGELTSIISKKSEIGTFETKIGIGTTILGAAYITNNVIIGQGSLIYMNTSITHDVIIGNYVQISPGVSILGRSVVGDSTLIGSNAVILPDLKVGSNCVIGAGTIVTKDIPDNSVVVGIPGKVIKNIVINS